ncbi:MAG: LacI family DNA-binding transcriptional regulator [Clostridia bacterium]|nr:LacI family DNA-binding transcriptional regulator [Clostridia bacterium]
MANQSNGVTIKSIAERLGVSFSTVSKALNGNPTVNPKTRRLVEETAKEMNYTRNVFASGLRQKGSRTVAIIVNDIDIPAYGEMIAAISGKLAEYGYSTMISDSRYSEEFERNSIRTMLSWHPEAVIIAPADPAGENLNLLLPLQNNTLVIGDPEDKRFNSVSVDHFYAGFASAEKLLKNGVRSNLVLGGPVGYRSGDLYLSGIRSAYEKNGMELAEKRVFHFKPDQRTAFRTFTDFWNESGEKCEGVLCFCDSMAYGVYRAAREMGLSIPADISVIGYDDGPANEFTQPPLTTVHMPKDLIAGHCADFVISRLVNKDTAPYNYRLKPYLANRESVRTKK